MADSHEDDVVDRLAGIAPDSPWPPCAPAAPTRATTPKPATGSCSTPAFPAV